MAEFRVGDRVTWHYKSWGVAYDVAGVVTKLGRTRVQIEVQHRVGGGGEWCDVRRWVTAAKLSAGQGAVTTRRDHARSEEGSEVGR